MKDYFKRAMDKFNEERNAVSVNIDLPFEHYILLEKLTDAVNKAKPEDMSIGEVISCILSSWEAMKLAVDEKRTETGVLVEFGKKNEKPLPPDERRIFLKNHYADVLDDIAEELNKQLIKQQDLILDSTTNCAMVLKQVSKRFQHIIEIFDKHNVREVSEVAKKDYEEAVDLLQTINMNCA